MIELLALTALLVRLLISRLFRLKSAAAYVASLYRARRSPARSYIISLALALLLLLIPTLINYAPSKVEEITITTPSRVEINVSAIRRPVVVLTLDVSGSMSGSKILAAKERVKRFLNSIEDVKVGFVAFSDRVVAVVKPTYNYTKIIEVVSLLNAGGGTFYSCALASAASMGGNGTHVILITDGEPKDPVQTRELVAQLVESRAIVVHGVFVGNSTIGREYLRNLTKMGGGIFVEKDVEELSKALSELASAISGQMVERYVKLSLVKRVSVPPLDLAGLALSALTLLFSLLSLLSSRWI